MHIETVKTYSCCKCEVCIDLSECEWDEYNEEHICPHCDQTSIKMIWERPAHWFSVAIYTISRNYGGPEEGGWYYDAGDRVDETVRTFKNTPEGHYDAERYLESLHALEFPTKSRGHYYEVYTSRGFSESLPDAGFPRRRPVYC